MMNIITIPGPAANDLGGIILTAIATARNAIVLADGGTHRDRAYRSNGDIVVAMRALQGAAEMSWCPAAQLAIDEALAGKPAPRPRILVVLEGGNVSDVLCDVPADTIVMDYDVEGADQVSDATYDIPQKGRDTTEEAYRSEGSATVDPAFITSALAAPLAMPSELDAGGMCERWITHTVGSYGIGTYSTGAYRGGFTTRAQAARDKLSLFNAEYCDAEGEPQFVEFLLPGDDKVLGDRIELGHRAIAEVLGGTKIDSTLRGPVRG